MYRLNVNKNERGNDLPEERDENKQRKIGIRIR